MLCVVYYYIKKSTDFLHIQLRLKRGNNTLILDFVCLHECSYLNYELYKLAFFGLQYRLKINQSFISYTQIQLGTS